MKKAVILFFVLLVIFISGCCNDQDIDIYVKSTITFFDEDYTDACIIGNLVHGDEVHECFGRECRLKEYYCNNRILHRRQFECDYGCEDGACRRSARVENCTDSDGGIDYYIRGTVREQYAPGLFSEYTDVCFGEGCLFEYYCANDSAEGIICPLSNGCSCEDGVCTQ